MNVPRKPLIPRALLLAALLASGFVLGNPSHVGPIRAKPVAYTITGRPSEQPWIGWRLPVTIKQPVRGLDRQPAAIELSHGGGFMGAECLFALWSLSVCDLENHSQVFAGQADAAISVADLSTWQIINQPGALISSLGVLAEAGGDEGGESAARVAVRIADGSGLASLVNRGEISTIAVPHSQIIPSKISGKSYIGTAIQVGRRSTHTWYAAHIPAFTLDNSGVISAGVALDFASEESLRIINSGIIDGDILLPDVHVASHLILRGNGAVNGRIINLQRLDIDNTEENQRLPPGGDGPAVVTLSGRYVFSMTEPRWPISVASGSMIEPAGVTIDNRPMDMGSGSILRFDLSQYDQSTGEALLKLPNHQLTARDASVYLVADGVDLDQGREFILISAQRLVMPSLDVILQGRSADQYRVLRTVLRSETEQVLKVRFEPR